MPVITAWTESVVTLQRQFRQKYRIIPPMNPQIFLDTRIGDACAKIDLEILRNAWHEFDFAMSNSWRLQ